MASLIEVIALMEHMNKCDIDSYFEGIGDGNVQIVLEYFEINNQLSSNSLVDC